MFFILCFFLQRPHEWNTSLFRIILGRQKLKTRITSRYSWQNALCPKDSVPCIRELRSLYRRCKRLWDIVAIEKTSQSDRLAFRAFLNEFFQVSVNDVDFSGFFLQHRSLRLNIVEKINRVYKKNSWSPLEQKFRKNPLGSHAQRRLQDPNVSEWDCRVTEFQKNKKIMR